MTVLPYKLSSRDVYCAEAGYGVNEVKYSFPSFEFNVAEGERFFRVDSEVNCYINHDGKIVILPPYSVIGKWDEVIFHDFHIVYDINNDKEDIIKFIGMEYKNPVYLKSTIATSRNKVVAISGNRNAAPFRITLPMNFDHQEGVQLWYGVSPLNFGDIDHAALSRNVARDAILNIYDLIGRKTHVIEEPEKEDPNDFTREERYPLNFEMRIRVVIDAEWISHK